MGFRAQAKKSSAGFSPALCMIRYVTQSLFTSWSLSFLFRKVKGKKDTLTDPFVDKMRSDIKVS